MSNIPEAKVPVTAGPIPPASTQAPPAAAQPASKLSIEELAKEVFKLNQKLQEQEAAAVKKAVEQKKSAGPAEIDWTKISEKDIVNLDIPIPVIEQGVPEYLTVHLLDQNYTCRWIHSLRERLGPCLSSGYNWVEEKDLDPRYPHPLGFDSNGHYTFGDVVCLKILKSRYYGALRTSYLKTMQIHGRAKTREKLQEAYRGDERLQEALSRDSLSIYTPDEDENKPLKGRTFTKDMFESV